MNIFTKIALKTMKENMTRTVVSIIGVILSTAMITAVVTFGVSFQNFMVEHAKKVDGDWHIYEQAVTEEEYLRMKDDPEVDNCVSMRGVGFGRMGLLEEENYPGLTPYLYLQTVNEEAADQLKVKLSKGRLPENENEIILQQYDLEVYNSMNQSKDNVLDIGDKITVSVGDYIVDGKKQTGNVWFIEDISNPYENFQMRYERSYTIVGVLESWGNSCTGGSGSDAFTGEIVGEEHLKENEDAPYNVYIKLKNPCLLYTSPSPRD